jgi:hypothetical protein
MESTMNDRFDKKQANKDRKDLLKNRRKIQLRKALPVTETFWTEHVYAEDSKNFEENRQKFQIRVPLPKTFYTEHVFHQRDVQICYANLENNKANKKDGAEISVPESSSKQEKMIKNLPDKAEEDDKETKGKKSY